MVIVLCSSFLCAQETHQSCSFDSYSPNLVQHRTALILYLPNRLKGDLQDHNVEVKNRQGKTVHCCHPKLMGRNEGVILTHDGESGCVGERSLLSERVP